MSVAGRARSLTRTGLKVQRRVALAQLLFWPSVLVTAAVAGAGIVRARRRAAAERPAPGTAVPVD
ncbi:hypothetical protein [Mycobacterium sp. SMC-4]|uniref:hypothetical protein n=1 Tax=Mycobacterium sp. SMC-4 TaxID=2857059 RepID=UPI0021B32B60|nr:hypothetical protein [Mycobacterium sp. SMC-4]UXA18404.1 hypothetical protein KXD98_01340 [Mycobacterium sp. SMC-4]